MHYCIIDIETTGGAPKSSKITEIAIIKHDGEKVIDRYETLLNPEMQIPPFIVNLTGISNKMVEDAPKFYEIAKQIVEFTESCVFVAHNIGFDYNIVRLEFKKLGFDYRRPHMCTVRASRHILPGQPSYSLGKLAKNLGIKVVGRHRAGGDAEATAIIFGMLLEKDEKGLKTFIQQDLNPTLLHPELDLEALEEIPDKTGVYKFFNEDNQLIYIGKSKHIRKRINQHLKNTKTNKGMQMMREIKRVEFELTGSELIALLYESTLIKQHQPIYNRMLRRARFPYGLFSYTDEIGYLHFFIGLISKTEGIPLTSFTTKAEASNFLERICEEYELCQKLCGLYKSQSSCFHYEIKKCKGACVHQEDANDYNARCEGLIEELTMNKNSFYIIDSGRQKSEKSLILIEDGALIGYGYAPYNFHRKQSFSWKQYIDLYQEDKDARMILRSYIRKNTDLKIVPA